MRFTCNVAELNEALSIAFHAIPVKSAKPVLEGIQIEAMGDSIILTSTDMAMGIECHVNASVEEEGSVVLPGRFFCEIARKLPGTEVSISVNERYVAYIQSFQFKTTIAGMDAIEFPELPTIKGQTLQVTEKQLKRLINGTLFSVAVDEIRPVLTGCLFEIENSEIRVVALDGYRLAICKDELSFLSEKIHAVIAGKILGDVAKILSDTEDMVTITFSRSHVSFRIGENQMIGRLLEGEYMPYKQIIYDDFMTRITINRVELMNSMDRAMLVGRESKSNLATLKIDSYARLLVILMNNTSMEEKIEIECEGKDLEIAFNVKYMLDILKSISDEEIVIRFKKNVNPCVICPPDENDRYRYLILPVRVS
ncbi:MAG: DNA polymerase III subunit beta [Clostridia bacterium]|nr:DNA polymerase III subunit beta [Clostridia bacterium]